MIINKNKSGGKYKRSTLEAKFEKIWLELFPELDLVVELCLIPDRKFRSDYTHLASKTTIEIHGGQFQRVSGHSSTSGKVSDSEKQNSLVVLGYRPFILWSSQVKEIEIVKIGEYIHGFN